MTFCAYDRIFFDNDNDGFNDNYDDNFGNLMIVMTKMTKKHTITVKFE